MSYKVFVSDAGQRKSVPIIRALGRAGVNVVCGESSRWSMGFYSKYSKKSYVYPHPEDEDSFINWIITKAKQGAFNVLFPIDERTMTPVTRHLEKLKKYVHIPVVDYQTYMLARNKHKTIEIAQELGIPTPKTWHFSTIEEFYNKKNEIIFPAVIKPRISSGSRGLKYVYNKEELERSYLNIHKKYPYPLIQEFLPAGGDTLGVEFLYNRGDLVSFFMHKRIREYPVSGGPSTLRISVYDKELIRKSSVLLSHIGWHGVAMVEYKVDPRDNIAKLMEINPKFWGSIALPIASGVNFPLQLYQLAIGGKILDDGPYKLNVRCRWLFPGDILHFIANPDRFKLKPSFFDFRGEYRDIVDSKDIGPIFGMLLSFFSRLFTKDLWTKCIFRVG